MPYRSNMSKIRHILFDCDGVLVDTEFVAAVRMTRALNNMGVKLSVEYFLHNLSGTTFSSIVQRYFNNTLSSSEVHDIVNGVEAEVATEVKLIDGVRELLISLSVNKSVVSNSSTQTVENALKVTGIGQHFNKKIFSSELVSQPKPSPDIYLLAIADLGYDESDIMVVEDSLSGAQAALSAGLKVIGFTGGSHIQSGHDQKLIGLGVSKIAKSMSELGTIITGASS